MRPSNNHMAKLVEKPPVLVTDAVGSPFLDQTDMHRLMVGEGVTLEEMPVLEAYIRQHMRLVGPISAIANGWRDFRVWKAKHVEAKKRAATTKARKDFQEREVGRRLAHGSQSTGFGFELWHPTTGKCYSSLSEFRQATKDAGAQEIGDLYEKDVKEGTLRATTTDLSEQEERVVRDAVGRTMHRLQEAARKNGKFVVAGDAIAV